jgi:hypothetical protein
MVINDYDKKSSALRRVQIALTFKQNYAKIFLLKWRGGNTDPHRDIRTPKAKWPFILFYGRKVAEELVAHENNSRHTLFVGNPIPDYGHL